MDWPTWWRRVEAVACPLGVTLRELRVCHRAFLRWFAEDRSPREAVLAYAFLVDDSDLVGALLPVSPVVRA